MGKKFAALVYGYKCFDAYKPNDVNLGDYIQSIAAMQYYPHVDCYVDRDELFNLSQDFRCIINGWYWLNERHKVVPGCNILPISIHISNQYHNQYRDVSVVKSWVGGGYPIGARDESTRRYLSSLGIPSYFSSCLTTTLDHTYSPIGSSQRSGVVFSDFDFNDAKIFGSGLHKLLRKNSVLKPLQRAVMSCKCSAITRVSHRLPLALSHGQRFDLAKIVLEIYRHAELVVTSRIHSALPCLAFRTPVILVVRKRDALRYSGLENLFNHIYVDDGIAKIQTSSGRVVNPGVFEEFAQNLKTRCLEYVGE